MRSFSLPTADRAASARSIQTTARLSVVSAVKDQIHAPMRFAVTQGRVSPNVIEGTVSTAAEMKSYDD